LPFAGEGVFQIASHTFKLRLPGGERILPPGVAGVSLDHVAHRHADGVEFVLYSQKLQRITTIAVNQVVLQLAQADDPARDIEGVADHGDKRNHQAYIKRSCRRPAGRVLHCCKDITSEQQTQAPARR
jgi:hypothetical protein